MAYLTEAIKDKHDVWLVTIIAHFFVVISLLPLYSHRFTSMFSLNVILVLNVVFGKSKMINLDSIERHKVNENNDKISKNIFLFVTSYIAGFLFSVSITFLYYLSFSFPQKALILSSLTQIINMFGSLLLVLFIDPRVMTSIDNGSGYYEIKILTTSRILVHITLILILFVI
jgi:cytochrome bd-type quinol oxidase subunit 2